MLSIHLWFAKQTFLVSTPASPKFLSYAAHISTRR